MAKRSSTTKRSFSKKRSLKTKRSSKKSRSKTMRKNKKSNNKTKRIFFRHRKHFKGGDVANYPDVIGIENRDVLYPISKYGITAGLYDPPALPNGPNGNGPYPGVLYGVYGGNGGGKKDKKRSSKRSGGRKVRRSKYHGGGNQLTFAPQPLVNGFRSVTGGISELVNGFSGYTNSASLNPMPYNQPIDQDITYLRTDFPNIAQNYNKADGIVSGI